LNNKLENIQNKKLALNSTALFHASSTVLLGLIYLFLIDNSKFIQINTGGYVLFDLYYMVMNGKYDLLRIMYLYHHMVVYHYVLLSPEKHYWPYVIFYAELSNIPNYMVYYNLKKDKEKHSNKEYKSEHTKQLLKIQMFFYAFFRIFVLGYYGLLELNTNEKKIPTTIYLTSILYIFGVIWFGAIVKQNINTFK